MPNTPAQLGRGMTVWYATPETSAEQREQARDAPRRARRADRGRRREPRRDGDRRLRHGPDLRLPRDGGAHRRRRPPRLRAPRRPRPRHRDARGQHALREAVRHAPRASSGTWSPRRAAPALRRSTSSNRAGSGRSCREAVWAAFRRTVELGEQLEAGDPGGRRSALGRHPRSGRLPGRRASLVAASCDRRDDRAMHAPCVDMRSADSAKIPGAASASRRDPFETRRRPLSGAGS